MSTTHAMATSAPSRTACAIRWPGPIPLRAPILKPRSTSANDREATAGARPMATPIATAVALMNSSKRQSDIGFIASGSVRGRRTRPPWISVLRTAMPMATPARPPTAASRMDSVSSCRATRQRLAPTAHRIASSRRRAVTRASSRLAVFPATSRVIKAAAANNSRSDGRTSPTTRLASGITSKLASAWSSVGNSERNRAAAAWAWWRAASVERPGASRATAIRLLASSVVSGSNLSGSQISGGVMVPGPNDRASKGSSSTPTTVASSPLTEIVLPTTSGSAASCPCHISRLRTATGAAPGRSSSSVKKRPRAGRAPKSRKKLAVTWLAAA